MLPVRNEKDLIEIGDVDLNIEFKFVKSIEDVLIHALGADILDSKPKGPKADSSAAAAKARKARKKKAAKSDADATA